jgi:hypothetical protein
MSNQCQSLSQQMEIRHHINMMIGVNLVWHISLENPIDY